MKFSVACLHSCGLLLLTAQPLSVRSSLCGKVACDLAAGVCFMFLLMALFVAIQAETT